MSVSNGDSSSSAERGLNADDFVLDLYRKRTFNDSFWAGVKVATVVLSYAVFPKPLLPQHVWSGLLVVLGLYLSSAGRKK